MKVTPVCRGGNSLISPPNVDDNKRQQIADKAAILWRMNDLSHGIPSVLHYTNNTHSFTILCIIVSYLET